MTHTPEPIKFELTDTRLGDAYDVRALRRLVAKTVRDGSCVTWTGCLNADGYGLFRYHGTKRAHRVAYLLTTGEIPEGLELDHLCRNRACVNPDHLEPVTGAVNQLRSPLSPAGTNARKTHCVRGHEFNAENTHVTRGERVCRTCWSARRAKAKSRLAS